MRILLILTCFIFSEVAAESSDKKKVSSFPALIEQAKAAYGKLTDYQCQVKRQERIHGKLMPETLADLSVQTQVNRMHFRFSAPPTLLGTEICYCADRDTQKVRVRGGGLKSALGFISLRIDDRRLTAHSKHAISEAGIGPLIEKLARLTEVTESNKCQFLIDEVQLDGQTCDRVEVRRSKASEQPELMVIHFSRQTQLPIKFESFESGRISESTLLESCTYNKLRLNPGLPDSTYLR
jgi:hypothetical protein